MAMAALTPEAQQLITQHRLGAPTAVYKPNTVLKVIGFLFVTAFFAAWTLFAASLTNSPLIPTSLYLLHVPPPSSFDATGTTIYGIFQIVFPLVGLLGIVFGLWQIAKTIGNRHARAVVCTNGVACVTSKSADAVRWEEALTVTHNIKVTTTTTHHQGGGTSTSTSVRHQYTLHCRDGRKILFDSTVFGGKVQRLGETLQVEVARRNQARGARP